MSTDDFPWPTVKHSLFGYDRPDPSSPTWCSLRWLKSFDLNEEHLANEYMRAGDMIVEQAENRTDGRHPDGLFLPVCYLYRHSLELLLKHVIRLGVRGGAFAGVSAPEKLTEGHNIGKLWESCRIALVWRWPNGDVNILNNAQALVRDFHTVDRTGQNLRYSHTMQGQPTTTDYPDHICLRYLADSFSTIFHFLDAVGDAPWSEDDVI